MIGIKIYLYSISLNKVEDIYTYYYRYVLSETTLTHLIWQVSTRQASYKHMACSLCGESWPVVAGLASDSLIPRHDHLRFAWRQVLSVTNVHKKYVHKKIFNNKYVYRKYVHKNMFTEHIFTGNIFTEHIFIEHMLQEICSQEIQRFSIYIYKPDIKKKKTQCHIVLYCIIRKPTFLKDCLLNERKCSKLMMVFYINITNGHYKAKLPYCNRFLLG